MSPEKGLTRAVVAWQPTGGSIAIVYIHAGKLVPTGSGRPFLFSSWYPSLPSFPLCCRLFLLFQHCHRIGDQVLKQTTLRETPATGVCGGGGGGGRGRGNWCSFVQPPLVQAFPTRDWFIYCAPTPYIVLCWAIICWRMHPMESCLQLRAVWLWSLVMFKLFLLP